MTDLIDRIKLARMGSAVERCHTVPHGLRYSVGHHSLDLITLIVLTWQAAHEGGRPSAELLIAAAFHDVPECITGDVPSPIKERFNGTLDQAEMNTLKYLGAATGLTTQEQTWLEAADRLELSLWALEESTVRGNKAVAHWVVPSDMEWWPDVFKVLLDELCAPTWLGYPKPLYWNDLKEIAGL